MQIKPSDSIFQTYWYYVKLPITKIKIKVVQTIETASQISELNFTQQSYITVLENNF